MARMGVFIGSAPLDLDGLEVCAGRETPWGEAASEPVLHTVGQHELVLMPRHGAQHEFAPHQINYRANVWLMQSLGVDYLVGTYTVGSVDPALEVAQLVVPDQLIDYTWGRASTYDDQLRHIVFSDPYDAELRNMLVTADSSVVSSGVYACCQGPRLETSAEVRRLSRDGCTLVGMTGMPEAALARELEIAFAGLCLVVNPAAGVSDEAIDLDTMVAVSKAGANAMIGLLETVLAKLV
jgi:5'-methylthioinosine phosphorylase